MNLKKKMITIVLFIQKKMKKIFLTQQKNSKNHKLEYELPKNQSININYSKMVQDFSNNSRNIYQEKMIFYFMNHPQK